MESIKVDGSSIVCTKAYLPDDFQRVLAYTGVKFNSSINTPLAFAVRRSKDSFLYSIGSRLYEVMLATNNIFEFVATHDQFKNKWCNLEIVDKSQAEPGDIIAIAVMEEPWEWAMSGNLFTCEEVVGEDTIKIKESPPHFEYSDYFSNSEYKVVIGEFKPGVVKYKTKHIATGAFSRRDYTRHHAEGFNMFCPPQVGTTWYRGGAFVITSVVETDEGFEVELEETINRDFEEMA